jgi:Domain of unknown function (DUF4281)
MTPETLFLIANPLAMTGWLVLAASPLAPRAAQVWAGYALPLVFALGYAVVVLVHFASAPGGFDTLDGVQTLFTSDWLALAGWVHYLAFDLLVGALIVRTARTEGIPHLLVLPILPLVLFFGPAGFLAFHAIRATRGRIAPSPHEATP